MNHVQFPSGAQRAFAEPSRDQLLLWLDQIDAFERPQPIQSEVQYRVAFRIKQVLMSLDCLAFNLQHPNYDRVCELETDYALAMSKFNKSLLIRDRRASLVARYLLWGRRFRDADPDHVFRVARGCGVLRRFPGVGGLVVVGLERKIGDNLFSTGRDGRSYRQFRKTIGRQAFAVRQKLPSIGVELDQFMASVHEIDDTYSLVTIGDGKHCSRSSAFDERSKHELWRVLASDWARVASQASGPCANPAR